MNGREIQQSNGRWTIGWTIKEHNRVPLTIVIGMEVERNKRKGIMRNMSPIKIQTKRENFGVSVKVRYINGRRHLPTPCRFQD
jgi:hypothetical protein